MKKITLGERSRARHSLIEQTLKAGLPLTGALAAVLASGGRGSAAAAGDNRRNEESGMIPALIGGMRHHE